MASKSKKKNISKNSKNTKQNVSKQNKAKKTTTKKPQKKEIQNKSLKQKQNKKDTKKSTKATDNKNKSKKPPISQPKKAKKTQSINKSKDNKKPKDTKTKKAINKKPQQKAPTKNQNNKKKQNTSKTKPKKDIKKQENKSKKPQKNKKNESKQNAPSIKWYSVKPKDTKSNKLKKRMEPFTNKKKQKTECISSKKKENITKTKTISSQTKENKTKSVKPKQNKVKSDITQKKQRKNDIGTQKPIKPKQNKVKSDITQKKQRKKDIETQKSIKPKQNKVKSEQKARKKDNEPQKKAIPNGIQNKAKKEKKVDRKHIQRKKDIETAKKRFNKRLSLKTNKTEIIKIEPNKPNKEKEKQKTKKQKTVNDNDFWSDYKSKYGAEPDNASQLQAFSKTDSKYTTLNYKTAKIIFDKLSTKKEEKSDTKKDRDKIYLKRDINTAKKRLSQRLNTKQINIIQKEINKETNDGEQPILNIITEKEVKEEDEAASLRTESDTEEEEEIKDEEEEIKDTEEDEEIKVEEEENKEEYIPPLPKRSTMDVLEQFKRNKIQTNAKNASKPALPKRKTLDKTQYKRKTLDHGYKGQRKAPPPRRKTVGGAKATSKPVQSDDAASQSIIEIEKFIESERVYVKRGLRICYEVFLHRLEIHNSLNESILNEDDIGAVFGNYCTLYNVNSKLFGDLMEIRLNEGIYALRDSLGQVMVNFIPYFRMYTDYIVKKHAAIARLEQLKKSNKKFKQFLKVNEMCAKRKLKSFLEEPMHRLPEYLQYLAKIYALYKSECNIWNSGQQLLLQSIVDIKNVSDEIATKCRNLKSRILVGTLQKDLFGNKIRILSPHRLCIAHCCMKMVLNKEKKLKSYNLILCNDILLISTLSSKFKSSNLISVHPLNGLRIDRKPQTNDSFKYKFGILPSNNIMICDTEQQILKWIQIIEESVEEEEYSLKQCNIIDIEKRIRKQKTSSEGEAEIINVTDPNRIKQIEAWRNEKYGLKDTQREPPKRRVTFNASAISVSRKPPPLPKREILDVKSGKRSPIPFPKPPPRRNTIDAIYNSPIVKEDIMSNNKSSNIDDNIAIIQRTERRKDNKDNIIPKRRKTVNEIAPKKNNSMRMDLLSGITSFKSTNLKHISAETLKTKAESEPQNITNLLQSTLKNYRQFVMDDDDDDDDTDNEWSD